MAFVIEPMRVEDIPTVMAIERESFTMLWSAQAYRREILENRLAHYFVVREFDDELITPDCSSAESDERGQPQPAAAAQSGPLRQIVTNVRHWLGSTDGSVVDRTIVGYVGFWMMVDEAHITTIAVNPGQRRRGLGELLLGSAIDRACELGARVVTLEVRTSNLSAQKMYEKYGFIRVGLRRRYYSDNNEDALIMTSPDITTASYQGLFQPLRRSNLSRLGRVCRSGF